jgi:hypothetical protein
MKVSVRLAAASLALAIGATACTGGDDHRGANGTGCRFEIAQPHRGDVPMSVDALTSHDVWVVGAHYEGGAGAPYARRWNGDTWAAVPVELVADANAGFHDVAAVSADDAWAVGNLRAREPMVQRWDGDAWTSVTVPAPGVISELFSVTATEAGAVWAVGRSLEGSRWRTLILRSNGRTWTRVEAPTPRGADAALRGVDATGPRDAWAVGWSVSRGRFRTLALHYDGTSWAIVRTPDQGLLSSVVAVGVDEAWAVGWIIGADGRDRPLVLRWNGDRWRSERVPGIVGRAQLTDVAADGPDDVWAAGRATDRTETFAPLLLRRDRGTWERIATPDVGADDDTLAGVTVAAGSPWGVGTSVDAEGRYTSLILSGC